MTTNAKPMGQCCKCGYLMYEGMVHLCATAPIYHTASGTVINPPEPAIPLTFDESETVKLLRSQLAACQREVDEWRTSDKAELIRSHQAEVQREREMRVAAQEALSACQRELEEARKQFDQSQKLQVHFAKLASDRWDRITGLELTVACLQSSHTVAERGHDGLVDKRSGREGRS